MTFEALKEKALSLPYAPGVYIMRDKTDKVIYVGKAKKLKNRVSQYFQDTAAHTPKTKAMVSKIDHFDVLVAGSEFEALVLECSLIKRYMPKYNILLKDDKGYPYIRLNMKDPYPTMTLVNKIANDGASYFGPYGSRGVSNSIMEAIRTTLKLPGCHKQFPRDIGKERPCLNYHMDRCAGWCQTGLPQKSYRATMEEAKQLLAGNYKDVAVEIKNQMLTAADNLEFELAATLRDKLNAVEALGQRQLVTALSLADMDAIGYGQTEAKACFTVLHFSGGNLLDKDYEVFPIPDDKEAALSSLIKQYYLSRGMAPKIVLLPWEMEDGELFAQLLEQNFGRRPHLRIPQRGDNVRLVEMAMNNAFQEAQRATSREEKLSGTLVLLGKMLGMDPPRRMESYDISNISGTDMVAGMVVFQDGKPRKSDYKRFKIEALANQDDYASMQEVISRRFQEYFRQKESGEGFGRLPDLILLDGGKGHVAAVKPVLESMGLGDIPLFGMVKDDKHRTRAIALDGGEISIHSHRAAFTLIGAIQEEVHRFAIGYHRQRRKKAVIGSSLLEIPGVGPTRAKALLRHFRTVSAIQNADLEELEAAPHMTKPAARAVYLYYHPEEAEEKTDLDKET